MLKSPVRVKTSPPIVVIEREVIVLLAADAITAPVNPAKATTINITHAGTCFRKRFIFSRTLQHLSIVYIEQHKISTDKGFMKSQSIFKVVNLFAKLSIKLLQEIAS
jgi:hypothetical protein